MTAFSFLGGVSL